MWKQRCVDFKEQCLSTHLKITLPLQRSWGKSFTGVCRFQTSMLIKLFHLKITLPLGRTCGKSSTVGVWVSNGVAQCGLISLGLVLAIIHGIVSCVAVWTQCYRNLPWPYSWMCPQNGINHKAAIRVCNQCLSILIVALCYSMLWTH